MSATDNHGNEVDADGNITGQPDEATEPKAVMTGKGKDKRPTLANAEIELYLLGHVLKDRARLDELSRELFGTPEHRAIYDAACKLDASDRPIDVPLLITELRKAKEPKSLPVIDTIVAGLPTLDPDNYPSHVEVAEEMAYRRDVLAAAQTVAAEAAGDGAFLAERVDDLKARADKEAAAGGAPEFEPGAWAGGDTWGTAVRNPSPSILPVIGGIVPGTDDEQLCLLYRGLTNVIFGAPGTGKTIAALRAIAATLMAGGTAAMLDFENDKNTVEGRLADMGVTGEQATRFFYWELDGPLAHLTAANEENGARKAKQTKRLQFFLDLASDFDLVVVDGVGASITMAGGDENKNTDAQRWEQVTLRPILKLESKPAILCIDHTGHDQVGVPKRDGARGGSAKLGDARGHVMRYDLKKAFSLDEDGEFHLTTTKCRPGHFTKGKIAAVGKVTPLLLSSSDQLEVLITKPDTITTTDSGKPRRTWYMEKASRVIEQAGKPLGKGEIERAVKDATGKDNAVYVREAVAVLVEEGYVDDSGRSGQKILHKVVRPFRQDEDENDGKPF